ncbi:unnamed protein product [Mucor hiemalis]
MFGLSLIPPFSLFFFSLSFSFLHVHFSWVMQLLGRLLTRKKKKTLIKVAVDDDTIASSTSTKNENKKFSLGRLCLMHRRLKSTKRQNLNKKDPVMEATITENQALLTQCIETALFNSPPTITSTNSIMNNNYVEKKSINFVDSQPHQLPQPRQRKLSLPPQYSHIGYLASIPEVDSYSE